MTESTLAELDRIVSTFCGLCRYKDSDLNADDCPCNDCRPTVDIANLVERLEARIPPEEGETIYCVHADCDHCPYPDANAYRHCQHCRLFVAQPESFSKSDHLDDFYEGRIFRNKADAEAKAVSWREESE